MRLSYVAIIIWLVLCGGNNTIAATNAVAERYAGNWVINVEETDLLREELDEKPTVLGGPGNCLLYTSPSPRD